MSTIIALQYISLSELYTVDKNYTEKWVEDNPKELEKVLRDLGLETNLPYEHQFCTHRNRFNNIITCSRWVGNEMISKEWLDSGYASQTAKDKASGSRLLADLYRNRGMTE